MLDTIGSSYDIDISLVVVISICYCIASLTLHKFREDRGYAPPIHESCIASLLGLLIGIVSRFILQESTIKFNQDIFFYLILPPIVFSAGYGLKKKKFFRFIHFITLFGILGTIINFSTISIATYYFSRISPSSGVNLTWVESMLLASVLAANDEISALSLIKIQQYPRLGGLIFGEGVINDALSIVLFKTLYSIYFSSDDAVSKDHTSLLTISYSVVVQLFCSCFIGLTCGLINARFMKIFSFSRKHPIHQTSLILLTGYLAYCIAEATGTSGILTLFVCAVTLSHYSWHSLSKSAQLSTRIMFVSLSDLAEGISFAYVGLSLWNYSEGDFSFAFSCYLLIVIIFSRFFTIVAICKLTNYIYGGTNQLAVRSDGYSSVGSGDVDDAHLKRERPRNSDNIIPMNEQIAFTLGGVVRGCLCWAQILQLHDSLPIATTATLFAIFVTTNGCGVLLPIVIPKLLDVNNVGSTSGAKASDLELKSNRNIYQTPGDNSDDINNSTYSMHVDHSDDEEANNDDIVDDSGDDLDDSGDELFDGNGDLILNDEANMELFQRNFVHRINNSYNDDDANIVEYKLSQKGSSGDILSPNMVLRSAHVSSGVNGNTSSSGNIIGDRGVGTLATLSGYQSIDTRAAISESTKKTKKKKRTNSLASGSEQARSYTHLFVFWVRIDELFLKPYFGGSKTGQTKSKLIELSNNVDVMSLLSPTKKINIKGVSGGGVNQSR